MAKKWLTHLRLITDLCIAPVSMATVGAIGLFIYPLEQPTIFKSIYLQEIG